MNDTRETAYKQEIKEDNSKCRFKEGDKISYTIIDDGTGASIVRSVFFDEEFGGWLVVLAGGCVGVHEQNFILESEKDLWEPHYYVLWSYWTKKK